MKLDSKGPWLALGLVLAWRLALLLLTAQPVPANDGFFFDGAVVNWLRHGHYFNASLAECFPISGHQVFAAYPPLYQGALLLWMSLWGTSVLSAMWFHFALFCVAAVLVVRLLRVLFPNSASPALAVLFLLAVTFDDRPEGMAHVFGLTALLLTALELTGRLRRPVAQAGTILALFCAMYTSLIVGGFYFGATLLTGVAAWRLARRPWPWTIGLGVTALVTAVTLAIAKTHPLLWQGFLENVHQTPVSTDGFHLPQAGDVMKIIRNAPVFLLAVACLPLLLVKRWKEENLPGGSAWVALTLGLWLTGLALLAGTLTLFTANYVVYLWYTQVVLAAGLLAGASQLKPLSRRALQAALVACLALVCVRAVGLSTWGVACARDVSRQQAEMLLGQELQPYANSEARVVASSAFLYQATALGVRGVVHADWAYDRRGQKPEAAYRFLSQLRPPKLLLTQFDFYRVYAPIVEQLRQHPELVSVKLRNTATVPPPDASPSLQRVLQHVSWAPVIVDLEWTMQKETTDTHD